MTVNIRSALPNDLPLIPGLEREAAQRFRGTAHSALADAAPSMTEPLLRRALQEDRLLVAEYGEALCGFALLEQHGADGWLQEFDVPLAFGGQGIGRALLAFSCAWARSRGCRRLTLTTFRNVPFNAPFYARFGFEELAPEETLPDHIREALAQEQAAGLRDRCAMALAL